MTAPTRTPANRKLVALVAGLSVLLIALAAVLVWSIAFRGKSDESDSAKTTRAEYCESFASITPGFFETSEAVATLADPGASQAARLQALKDQLAEQSGKGRTWPYDCNRASDQARFNKFMADAEAK